MPSRIHVYREMQTWICIYTQSHALALVSEIRSCYNSHTGMVKTYQLCKFLLQHNYGSLTSTYLMSFLYWLVFLAYISIKTYHTMYWEMMINSEGLEGLVSTHVLLDLLALKLTILQSSSSSLSGKPHLHTTTKCQDSERNYLIQLYLASSHLWKNLISYTHEHTCISQSYDFMNVLYPSHKYKSKGFLHWFIYIISIKVF